MKWVTQVMEEAETKRVKDRINNFNRNIMENGVPRRMRLDLATPAELAIYNAMQEVEKLPADERLTKAVVLLGQAKEWVADYVDNDNSCIARDVFVAPSDGNGNVKAD